jgi:hypothetical protein
MKRIMNKILPVAFAAASLSGLLAESPAAPGAASVSVNQKDEETPATPPPTTGRKRSGSHAGGGGLVLSGPNNKNGFEAKTFTFNNDFVLDRSRFARPLIIRNEKTEGKVMDQLREDLTVMSRILEKSVAEFKDDHQEAAGIALMLHGGAPIRAMYLEGYGVVFTVNVNIPLKAEPKAGEAEEKDNKGANEEWQEARNEVFGQKRRFDTRKDRGAHREFSAAEVDEVRNSLTDALRNATNIRNLNANEWVTVVVRGRGGNDLDAVAMGEGGNFRVEPNGKAIIWDTGSTEEAGLSTMVLRIKKSDVDNLSKKEKTDELRAQISVTTY